MRDSLSQQRKLLINFVYRKIFHEEMGEEADQFLQNVFYVGIGTFLVSICSFIFNILAGRIMGPSTYGTFTFIQSIALVLSIPMQMGLVTAMVKYCAEERDFHQQKRIISTTYILIFLLIILSTLSYLIFSPQILAITAISIRVMQPAILLSILYVFFTLTLGTLRGLYEMKKFAVIRPLYNIILLASFLIFLANRFVGIESMVYSMYLGYGITGFIILALLIRKNIGIQFDKRWTKKIVRYSSITMIGVIASILYSNIDLIFIERFMSLEDVGIYSAYHWAFITFSMLFSGIFVTVFFPFASKYENKEVLLKRINRIVPIIGIIGFPTVIVFGVIILGMYGNEYPLNMGLSILFGIGSIILFVDSVYAWLMNSLGSKGVKVTSFAAALLAVTNIILNIMLIPLMGLNGAISAKVVSFTVSILVILSRRKYLMNP